MFKKISFCDSPSGVRTCARPLFGDRAREKLYSFVISLALHGGRQLIRSVIGAWCKSQFNQISVTIRPVRSADMENRDKKPTLILKAPWRLPEH